MMLAICTIHLFKPTEGVTPRVNHNVNCCLRVIMACHCRFTSCDRCAPLVAKVNIGKPVHGGGGGGGRGL